ncbi:hypothetical protein AUJ68_04265 [Candidatus Woesearchaeota archaeon CG1_02_57_44]|nr:MAG: hypothetical protein AUJ68_04265 [Candidatus Woesearchaeota archaeon CG1_02_57_44]PIN69011.1 MAG: hypothetical protein COV94_03480 [Candidatus Woesearchaeota archaeon CG11_big_fil_rev_8_21_14_0_20_57_5]
MRQLRLLPARVVAYPDMVALQLSWLDGLGKGYVSNYQVHAGHSPESMRPVVADWKHNRIRLPVGQFLDGHQYYFSIWSEHPDGDGITVSNTIAKRVHHSPETSLEKIQEKRNKLFGQNDLF